MQPNKDPNIDAPTIGKVLLKSRGFFTDEYWYWICIGALFAFSVLFNILFIGALNYLDRELYLISVLWFLEWKSNFNSNTLLMYKLFSAFRDSKSIVVEENDGKKIKNQASEQLEMEGYFIPLLFLRLLMLSIALLKCKQEQLVSHQAPILFCNKRLIYLYVTTMWALKRLVINIVFCLDRL